MNTTERRGKRRIQLPHGIIARFGATSGFPTTFVIDAQGMIRLKLIGAEAPAFEGAPTVFWDVFGEQGHPVRATVSDLGPLLFSRILNLNDIQSGVLALVFKVADDGGLLLLDLKDLRAMLQHVGDNAAQFQTEYGNVSAASIGAIQRGLMQIEAQGGDRFFGEPMLNIDDLLQTDAAGKGVVNILAADKLMNSPRLSTRCGRSTKARSRENSPDDRLVWKVPLVPSPRFTSQATRAGMSDTSTRLTVAAPLWPDPDDSFGPKSRTRRNRLPLQGAKRRQTG